MSNTEHKSTDQAERDVEEARSDLHASLNDLEQHFSPEALVDQTISYFRGDGRRHLGRLAREARENPLSIVLVGIGLTWLAVSASRRSSDEERIRLQAREDFRQIETEEERYRSARAEYDASRAEAMPIASQTSTAEFDQTPLDEMRQDTSMDPDFFDTPPSTEISDGENSSDMADISKTATSPNAKAVIAPSATSTDGSHAEDRALEVLKDTTGTNSSTRTTSKTAAE